MRRAMSFITGAVMGALVGATLAVLFAPESGVQIRAMIQERSRLLQEELKTAAAERRAELEQQLAALRAPHKPV